MLVKKKKKKSKVWGQPSLQDRQDCYTEKHCLENLREKNKTK